MKLIYRIKLAAFNICQQAISWVSKITVEVPSESALPIDPTLPVCYVISAPSTIDTIILANACQKVCLPAPFYDDGKPVVGRRVFFLHPSESLLGVRRTKPTPPRWMSEKISELQNGHIADIQLVPVTICIGRAPEKEQSTFKPLFSFTHGTVGLLKKILSLLIHGRDTLVHFNSPVSLQLMLQEKQDQQLMLRKLSRILRVHFRRQREQIVGPDLSHRRTLIRSIINTPAVEAAIQREAKNSKISYEDARAKALSYGHEIASDFSFAAVRFFDRILSWFWQRFFKNIEINNLEMLKSISYNSTIIYAPCHRSHLDYLLLSYVLYKNGLTVPHAAGGINLNMPIIGTLLRRGGAFFIRRSFSGNALYGAVFTEYLHSLLMKGFPVEYFIEGGRSRTGRSLRPKTGLLAMTLASYLRQPSKNMQIVPIYIGYDRIMEARSYLGELRGKAKQKETPLALFKAITKLKMNFGRVYLDFGAPIDIGQFLNAAVESPEELQSPHGRPAWLNQHAKDLGDVIVTRINQAIAVNPINLLAITLLATPRLCMSREDLVAQLTLIKQYLDNDRYSFEQVITSMTASEIIEYGAELEFLGR